MELQLATRFFIKSSEGPVYWNTIDMKFQHLSECEPFFTENEAISYLNKNINKVFNGTPFVTIETIYYPI